MERIKALLEGGNWIPFVLAAGAGGEHRKMSFQRLLEVLITGIVSGSVAVLIAFYVLQNDVRHLSKEVSYFTEEAKGWHEKTDSKINGFIREFDTHKHSVK